MTFERPNLADGKGESQKIVCEISDLSGFEPGVHIYLAAFTNESRQLVKLPTGLGNVFTPAGDYDQTDGKEM